MKQYTAPIYVKNDVAEKLESIQTEKMCFSEEYIQNLCYEHPVLLPVIEIEQIFSGLIPLCKELSMPSGFCDIAYINEEGLITLVECKLWKNPEARRKVIGQILDYAKDLSVWNYEMFEKQCIVARKGDEKSLIDIIKKYAPDIEEVKFIDNVMKNIIRGRFLLLIVGDGIRENMEEMVEFLNQYGKLSFTLSLVELPVFKIHNEDEIIITPRVLAKTLEINREIREKTLEINPRENNVKNQIAISNSESEFFDRLEKNIGKQEVDRLKMLILEFKEELHITTKLGRGKKMSMNIKTSDDGINLASIQENGEVWFYGILEKAQELGSRTIGDGYLSSLAKIMNAEYDKHYSEWLWGIKRNGSYLKISEYIENKEKWKQEILKVIKNISDVQE